MCLPGLLHHEAQQFHRDDAVQFLPLHRDPPVRPPGAGAWLPASLWRAWERPVWDYWLRQDILSAQQVCGCVLCCLRKLRSEELCFKWPWMLQRRVVEIMPLYMVDYIYTTNQYRWCKKKVVKIMSLHILYCTYVTKTINAVKKVRSSQPIVTTTTDDAKWCEE